MSAEKDKKGYSGAPFGYQSTRFDVSGIHPKRKLPGTLTQVPGGISADIGPGSYDVLQYNEFSAKSVDSRAQGPNWKRAYDVHRQSQIPHLLYKEQHAEKEEQKRKLGPGYYDVAGSQDHRMEVSKRGLLDIREPRFRGHTGQEGNPGPGSYGKSGVPHLIKEEMDEQRRHCGRVGMLDCGGSRAPPQQGADVGPGTYQIPSFTDLLAAKKAGKNSRGPYEVFSLDRDQAPKTGHYARLPAGNLGPGQYNFKDGVADLNRPEKRNQGKFLKMVQYPAKPCDRVYWMTPATVPPDPANKVSAASYHPADPNFKKESFSKSEAGFLSTSTRQDKRSLMFFTKNFNQVGPGRYDIQRQDDSAHVNAHTSDFVSKTGARLSQSKQQIYKERLRDKDIPPGRRFRVDHVATEKEPFVNIQPLFAARDPLVIQ